MRRSLMRPWTDADHEVLQSMIADKAPLYMVAHRLRRSLSSVRTKMNKLVLHVRSDGDLRSGRATLRTETLRASEQKSPAAVKQPGDYW